MDRYLTEILCFKKQNKNRQCCRLGRAFPGTTSVPLHKHSRPPPKQCKNVKAATWESKKDPAEKKSVTTKYRAEKFLNDIRALGDVLFF